jgi:hypothetical protein
LFALWWHTASASLKQWTLAKGWGEHSLNFQLQCVSKLIICLKQQHGMVSLVFGLWGEQGGGRVSPIGFNGMLPGRMTWLELQHKVMTARPRQHRVTIDSQWAEQAHQAHQAQQAKQAQQAQHPSCKGHSSIIRQLPAHTSIILSTNPWGITARHISCCAGIVGSIWVCGHRCSHPQRLPHCQCSAPLITGCSTFNFQASTHTHVADKY